VPLDSTDHLRVATSDRHFHATEQDKTWASSQQTMIDSSQGAGPSKTTGSQRNDARRAHNRNPEVEPPASRRRSAEDPGPQQPMRAEARRLDLINSSSVELFAVRESPQVPPAPVKPCVIR
jgi:hypothetical protein